MSFVIGSFVIGYAQRVVDGRKGTAIISPSYCFDGV